VEEKARGGSGSGARPLLHQHQQQHSQLPQHSQQRRERKARSGETKGERKA
jgi:hypothetical protein